MCRLPNSEVDRKVGCQIEQPSVWSSVGSSSDRGDANTRAGGPCVHGLWLGGVSVSVRRASEDSECVMSSEYERRGNNDSSEQSQKHPDTAVGGSRGWLSVVPARDSQGERRAIVSDNEDKKIGHRRGSLVERRRVTPGVDPSARALRRGGYRGLEGREGEWARGRVSL